MFRKKRIGEIVCQMAVYALALFVVVLNGALAFDNVAWGDEAFSINTAQNTFGGILQILYYCDNHPPLHYFWLKIWGDIFGHTFPVYHLASLSPFVLSIILVVTVIKKRLGNIPASFLTVILGFGYFCIEYNLEIRMYSLAFLGVLMSFYCAYRVLCEDKKSSYTGMVLWSLLAAYSHYYGLVTVGIMMFLTTVAVFIKNRGKAWIKGAVSIGVFLIAYAPWLYFLFHAMKNVSSSWWMTDILSLKETASMVLGGHGFNWFILALLVVFLVAIFVPEKKSLSNEAYAVAVGLGTIITTVAFAYFICFTFKPMLAQRYMYPLSAVTFLTLAIAMSRILQTIGCLDNSPIDKFGKFVKIAGVALVLLFLGIGIENYKVRSSVALDEENKTRATLNLIGEPKEDTILVTNGVKHLGWTILPCYFPETEYINGTYYSATKDKFWYFNPTPISEEELRMLMANGYDIRSYGQMQISQYVFSLYYMEKKH